MNREIIFKKCPLGMADQQYAFSALVYGFPVEQETVRKIVHTLCDAGCTWKGETDA